MCYEGIKKKMRHYPDKLTEVFVTSETNSVSLLGSLTAYDALKFSVMY